MGLTLETVVFYFLAVFIIAMSILTVTTQRIVRSATYLLFVLFGTAGIYFLLGYTFLGSVQIMVYAGGIVVLYVFSILLTSGEGDRACHYDYRCNPGALHYTDTQICADKRSGTCRNQYQDHRTCFVKQW